MMTKKHFETVAAVIAGKVGYDHSTIDFDAGYNTALKDLAVSLADTFEDENPRFDRAIFLLACGITE